MSGLIALRFTMWATVLPKLDKPTTYAEQPQPTGAGHFERYQDPDSFEITSVWVPDSPTTPGTDQAQLNIPCYARGYTNLGFRSSGNRETFVSGDYTEVESIQFDYPAKYTLSRQSLVTNIRTSEEDTGLDYCWIDGNTGKPVAWEVQGITPVNDPFGKLLRYTTVLKRSEIQ